MDDDLFVMTIGCWKFTYLIVLHEVINDTLIQGHH